jgi:hypothetical protein
MAQIVRLGSTPRPSARPPAAASVDPRRGLLIAALVTVIALALSVIVYVSLPRTPANIVAGPPTPDVSDDSAVFDPKVAEVQHQVQQAQQEKEDSAVFGQAPSAPVYQYSSR